MTCGAPPPRHFHERKKTFLTQVEKTLEPLPHPYTVFATRENGRSTHMGGSATRDKPNCALAHGVGERFFFCEKPVLSETRTLAGREPSTGSYQPRYARFSLALNLILNMIQAFCHVIIRCSNTNPLQILQVQTSHVFVKNNVQTSFQTSSKTLLVLSPFSILLKSSSSAAVLHLSQLAGVPSMILDPLSNNPTEMQHQICAYKNREKKKD